MNANRMLVHEGLGSFQPQVDSGSFRPHSRGGSLRPEVRRSFRPPSPNDRFSSIHLKKNTMIITEINMLY